ncbi:MAG: type IV pilus biogenesis/stability protein PilW [Gammaproteobacteria bacterium]|nr:type IV pilus biogenesis/stability protein PilW [Gammaproteobacteria bacterium]
MRRAARGLAVLLVLLVAAGCSSGPRKFESRHDSPADINAKLGLSYMQQGDYDVALEKLKKALEQDPDSVTANHYIAELYRLLGNHELAEQHYKKALRLDANNPAVQNNFGVFLCDRKRYDEAEKHFMLAARIPSYRRPDEAYENAGLCALRIPDATRAEKYFRQALDINPLLPNALYQMALLNFNAGQHLSARAFLQRYAAFAAPTPQTLWLAVRVERALDNGELADQYALELRTKFPQSQEAAELRQTK